jgi:Peptidase inhibitor I78 family
VSIGSGFHAGRTLVALALAALGSVLGGSGAWAGGCQAEPAQALLGKPYTEALRAKAQIASRARLVQALRRGEATTTEFRSDRLDIIIDPKTDAVIGVWCG